VRYDASVVIPKSADGNSSAGAWVMRRRKDDSKVNDLASQEKLVKDLLAEVAKAFAGTPDWPYAYRVVESSKDKTLSDGPPPPAVWGLFRWPALRLLRQSRGGRCDRKKAPERDRPVRLGDRAEQGPARHVAGQDRHRPGGR